MSEETFDDDEVMSEAELRQAATPVRLICLPAIASELVQPPELAEKYIDGLLDPKRLNRRTLRQKEAELGQFGFAGQYKQRPIPDTGGMFKTDQLKYSQRPPDVFEALIRFWDKAGTADGDGACTAGVKMGRARRDVVPRFWVLDVCRGRWDSWEREKIIKQTAIKDGKGVRIGVEQEPGPIWEEELVTMASGRRRRLKKIKIGDMVIGQDGNPHRVTAVHKQGVLKCLKITTASGRTIFAESSHPFLTPAGWVPAGKLSIGDPLALRVISNFTLLNSVTKEECRLAGYFVGDGCCTFTKRGNSINASVTCSDDVEGLDIVHCVQSIGAKTLIYRDLHYRMSGGIRDWLWKRKLAGKRTENKIVPSWIWTASNECVANFIGAFFACDGSIYGKANGQAVEFYNTSLKLLQGIQSLLLRFGIYSRLRKKMHKVKPHYRDQYVLQLKKGDDSQARFAEFIPVHHSRKSVELGKIRRREFIPEIIGDLIVSIDPAKKMLCRCLSVEKAESFICNDFIVHNSGGKESAQNTIRNLAGFRCYAERPTGDKAARADPFSVQVNAGNVGIVIAHWNDAYVNEMMFFDGINGLMDQIDASSGCFNWLVHEKKKAGSAGFAWLPFILGMSALAGSLTA